MHKKTVITTDELTRKRFLCTAEGSSPQAALNDIISNHRKEITESNKEMFRQRYGCTVTVTELYGNSNYCPAHNNGYRIIEKSEIEDLDGSKCGTVLAKTKGGQFATWQYTYFPKDDFFNGFNSGNYFNDEISATIDYHRRCAERAERVALQRNVNSIKSLQRNEFEKTTDNSDCFIEDEEMEI